MNRLNRPLVLVVLSVGLLASAVASAVAPPAPDYFPTCGYAQDIAPIQLAGGALVQARNAVVWNGKDFAVAWVEYSDKRLYVRRFYADGTPVGPATTVSTRLGDPSSSLDMVWTGNGYAIVWAALDTAKNAIFMVRLDASGAVVAASETRIGVAGSSADSASPALAFGGGYYLCTYTYKLTPNVDHDIYGALVNASTFALQAVYISNPIYLQDFSTVAWFPAANAFAVAWDDDRNSGQYRIYGNTVTTGGTLGTEKTMVTPPGTAWARVPHLAVAASNGFLGMTWGDLRNTFAEPYFARFDPYLAMIGSEARLVPETSWNAYNPRIYWTGAEFVMFFEDFRGGNRDAWCQAVTATGAADGTSRQVTFTSEVNAPVAAFARYGWLVAGFRGMGSNYVQPVGCNFADTPPCPENAIAYNVSGSQVTLSWLPSMDPSTDIAYYQVYRNNVLVGITDNTVFTDTGLSLGTTYNYAIRTVNAAQMVSTGCPATASVYVKTNASLTLTLSKQDPNALLSWSDVGMVAYKVFRGTNPQVMQEVATLTSESYSDPNVLKDSVLYFYTVDDPGQ